MNRRYPDNIRLLAMAENANGGTEAMLDKLVSEIPSSILSKVDIHASRLGDYRPERLNVYYGHDLPNDYQAKFLTEYKFDAYVFVSHWQAQQFVKKFPKINNVHVIHNSTSKAQLRHIKSLNDPIRLIYHTTPHRGLELLWCVFKALSIHHNITLDVFSSFKAYGWESRDKPYIELFDEIRNHPKSTYHGYQKNHIVMGYLSEADIFAYPCIWTETSCISLIEAMTRGVMCIHPDSGALPETSLGLTDMYSVMGDNHHDIFRDKLTEALSNIRNEEARLSLESMARIANDYYTGDGFRKSWLKLLEDIT